MITEYVGRTVSFSMYAPSVLGEARHNVTVVAVLDLDTAKLLSDVVATHMRVASYMPSLPTSAGSYHYVKVRYSNGDTEILGVPWIDATSIEVIQDLKLNVTIRNITGSTETVVRQALLQNGIEDFTIEVVGS